jgi:TetR/AcrR family tetracycline transcriptional repressor
MSPRWRCTGTSRTRANCWTASASASLPASGFRRRRVSLGPSNCAPLDALRPHAEVAGLVYERVLSSEAGLTLAERTLALLRHAGLSTERAAQVGGYLLNAVAMLVTTEPGREHGSDAEARDDAIHRKTASLSVLPLRRYPTVVSSAGVLAACPSPDAYFSLGLDMLIAGVTAIADDGPPAANPA